MLRFGLGASSREGQVMAWNMCQVNVKWKWKTDGNFVV